MVCAHPVNDGRGNRFACGRCINCKINRSQVWSLRLQHELQENEFKGVFVTLTYSNEYLPNKMTLVKAHLSGFIKRLRNEELIENSFKYYGVGEYGELNQRPHYHIIIIGKDFNKIRSKYWCEKYWKFGFSYVDTIINERISYVTDYVTKKLYGKMANEEYKNRIGPFSVMSKGIGLSWLMKEENQEFIKMNMGIRKKGKVFGIPRYYRKKLEEDGNGIPVELLNDLDVEKSNKVHENYTDRMFVDETMKVIEGRLQVEADTKARRGLKRKRDI